MFERRHVKLFALAVLLTLLALAPSLAAHLDPHPPPYALAQPLAVIDACGEVTTDTTWSTGNVYTATNCNVIVNPGATLTLQAGVIVKVGGGTYSTYDSNAAFVVKGTLRAEGTEANPVVFTSWRDDAHGGDTNGDGDSTGSPGEWYGLHFMPDSQGDLSHTHVYYAGSGQYGRWDGTSYTNRAQIYVDGAAVSLQHSEVAFSPKAGVALYGADTQAVIDSTRIISNTGQAVAYRPGAIYQDTLNMSAVYHNLTLEDNILDVVALDPYGALTGDVILDGAPLMLYGSLVVPDGHALILKPGTLLRQHYYRNSMRIEAGGHLTATGTLTNPVVFAPASDEDQWGGIRVDEGASANLSHTEIRDAGYWEAGIYAGLWLQSSEVILQDVRIHDSVYDGLRISGTGTQATLENVILHDNARDGLALWTRGGHVTLTGGAIYSNTRDGVRFNDAALSGEEIPRDQTLALDNVTLSNNGGDGLHIRSISSTLTLQNVTITHNSGAGFLMHPDNDSPVFTNTTVSGNGLDGIALYNGMLEGERRWNVVQPDLPFILRNVSLTIRNDGMLTLAPGVTLRLGLVGSGYTPKINVQGNARLIAEGTPEQPIRFVGLDNTPGRWGNIALANTSAITLTHCEVAYGGRDQDFGGMIPLLDIKTTGAVRVEDCTFRDSWGHGIFAGAEGDHVVRNSRIYNVSIGAQKATTFDMFLDARYNWWGHSSGPRHTTLNPDGQGVSVSGNVLFTPWLTESPLPPSGVQVNILGPRQMASGQTTMWALDYAHHLTETMQNAVLIATLPSLATLQESSDGGIFWPERHQVFWKLGDLAPETSGRVWVRVQFDWGIPDGQVERVVALLAGDNVNAELLDTTPYLAYTPLTTTETLPLTQTAWDAYLATNADLTTLYTQALAEGYMWASAERISLSNGDVLTQAIVLREQEPWLRALISRSGNARATTFGPDHYTMQDTTGGLHYDMLTEETTFWGSWDLENGAAWPGTTFSAAACATSGGAGCCVRNCLNKVAWNSIMSKLQKPFSTLQTAHACTTALRVRTAEALVRCAERVKDEAVDRTNIPGLGELMDATECLAQCAGDPNSNDCTSDLVTCEESLARYAFKTLFDVPSKTVWRCQSGCYSSKPEYIFCAFGECCMPGVGCTSGDGEGSDCQGSQSYVARDPNEKHGPEGDLLPGEWVDYRIEYENVGEAPAFGVFITDHLHEAFDDATLQLGPNAEYFPSARLIVWDIGELDPTGEPGATGEVTLTVRLRDDLPGGTIVTNQAVVYFPSVPEETPTSVLVHMIQPAVAEPQTLTTTYATPVSVTLTGREVSSAALTYHIVEEPAYGVLSGTLPHLTYTPMEDYAGPDRFSFVVNNGTLDSSPAQVHITITPEGDTQAPTVLWTVPADSASVTPSATALFTDAVGPLYGPGILIGFSEPLDPTTVHSSTVTLSGDIALHIAYDPASQRILAYPRAPLSENRLYTARVTTGVTDLAGNPLAEDYMWGFDTGESPYRYIYLPLVLRQ